MTVEKLGLGTAQLGGAYGISNCQGEIGDPEAGRILDLARAAGVSLIDTAAAYGAAEVRLGRLLAIRPDFRVVTKTRPLDGDLGWVLAEAEASVTRLGVGVIDSLLVHRSADLLGAAGEALWRGLEGLRRRGLTRRLGVSVYEGEEIKLLLARFPLELIQAPVSLLDQRLIVDGTLASLADRGIAVHARSLFLQGLVFLDPDSLPRKVARAAPALHRLRALLANAGADLLTATISFVLAQPAVEAAIVGVANVKELQAILEAAGRPPLAMNFSAAAVDDASILNPSLWS